MGSSTSLLNGMAATTVSRWCIRLPCKAAGVVTTGLLDEIWHFPQNNHWPPRWPHVPAGHSKDLLITPSRTQWNQILRYCVTYPWSSIYKVHGKFGYLCLISGKRQLGILKKLKHGRRQDFCCVGAEPRAKGGSNRALCPWHLATWELLGGSCPPPALR